MSSFKGDDLFITRGDTLYLEVLPKNYHMVEGDKVIMSVKKKATDEEYVLQTVAYKDEVLYIAPSQTKDCEVGRYVYDIQLTTSLGEVFTIITGYFVITQEITVNE